MTQSPTMQIASGTPRSNNTLVWWLAVMAGLSNAAGAVGLADVLPEKWLALFVILTGSLQAGTAAFVAATKPVQTPVEVVTVDMHRP